MDEDYVRGVLGAGCDGSRGRGGDDAGPGHRWARTYVLGVEAGLDWG